MLTNKETPYRCKYRDLINMQRETWNTLAQTGDMVHRPTLRKKDTQAHT